MVPQFRARSLTKALIGIGVLTFGLQCSASAQTKPLSAACNGYKFDPAKDFVGNFNNPCFATTLNTGHGANLAGDSNATYDQIVYQVIPGYELILLGTFPNGRFMSATVYDDHLAVTSRLLDYQIQPLSAGMTNPYLTGAVYQPGSTYGLTIGFGSPVGPVAHGCQTTDTTIDQNFLDASQIHQGLSWDGYPGLPANFPAHETGANAAGIITIRRYLDISNAPTSVIIVRQLSNGCALNAQAAINMKILSLTQSFYSPWLHQSQISAHQQFAQHIHPKSCFPSDPQNSLRFFRSQDYIPLVNAGANIDGLIPSSTVQAMVAGQYFMRVRFVLAKTPNIPCATGNCSLTGLEDLRYMSLAFQGAGTQTLASISDTGFVTDSFGNVTLIVSLGAVPPPTVTAANGYTYYDLTQIRNYTQFGKLELRNLLPNTGFSCSTFSPPFYTMEYNNVGGYMGAYVPTVDFPGAADLTATPTPPTRTNTCSLMPNPMANNCSTVAP